MPSIIISHHQSESSAVASQLAAELRSKFSQVTVYDNVGAVVSPGDDYEQAIQTAVNDSDVLIVVMAAGWAVDDPDDYDRIALQSALDNNKRIVPVLVDDARMPSDLPESLSGLKRRMGTTVNQSEPDFSGLLTAMEQLVGATAAKASTPPPLVPQNKPAPVQPPAASPQPPPQAAPPPSPWQTAAPQGQMPPPQGPYGQPQPSGPYPPQGAPYPPQGAGYGGPGPMGGNPPQKIVGGLLMLFSALLVISFLVLPWFSFDDNKMEDAGVDFLKDSSAARELGSQPDLFRLDEIALGGIDGCKITGIQVVTQSDGNSDCGSDSSGDSDIDEPAIIPLLEYGLIVFPIFALIVGIAGFRIFQDLQLDTGKLRTVMGFSVMLVLIPFLWQMMYTSGNRQLYEDATLDAAGMDDMSDLSSDQRRFVNFVGDLTLTVLETGYTTVMQTILPALLLITGIGGVLIAQRKQPTGYPPPYQGQPMPPYQQQPPPRY